MCESCGATFAIPARSLLDSRLTEEQEAALVLPKPVSVILGLLGIGGAAIGLVAAATSASSVNGGLLGLLILVAMAGLYVFGAYCGLRALQRRYGWVRLNQVLWAIQVPVLTSPLVKYSFSTGGFITAWLQFQPAFSVGGSAFLGSNVNVNLFTPGPTAIGVNLFALGISYYLAHAQCGDA